MWKVTGKYRVYRDYDNDNPFYFLEIGSYKMQVTEEEYNKYKYGDEYPKKDAWSVK